MSHNVPETLSGIRAEGILFAQKYLEQLCAVVRGIPLSDVAQTIEILEEAYVKRRTLFIAGNGGSASTASHMASDLSKTVISGDHHAGVGFRTIALTDNVPLITAWANDVGFEEALAGQLRSLGNAGDVLILISGSGRSRNLLRIVEVGRELGLKIIALLGKGGGPLKPLVDVAVVVPSDDYGPIEDVHLALNHLLTSYFKKKLQGTA